jgi:creatinine amidohydrolase/Fe(II)-dependent formamide hydrolase-like protein
MEKQKENITFGLGAEENERYSSFWSLYFMPFITIFKKFRFPMLLQPQRYLSVLVFVGIVVPAIYLNQRAQAIVEMPEYVFIEDMTWKEVDQALKFGSRTILIPTGGTEQNGPHMILGKHNYIVKYTAGKVAEQLGNALVAPVLSYVPEGPIDFSKGHMRFSGTLSIAEDVFAKNLEYAARSMKQHGFKVIAFIGDSGGNQAMQALVAEQLNKQWKGEGIKVIHVDDYYQDNGQMQYLQSHGYSIKQIGGHAGIRDSSELLAVHPQGIRKKYLLDYTETLFSDVGADGDASIANSVIGKYLLKLKINAAVAQVQREVNKASHTNLN